MPVEAIGGVINAQDATLNDRTTIQQEDFIRLFLSQLQFQDPLEPLDNREFLAQLAQFSSLEQSRQTSGNTEGLLSMGSATQALALLGKTVEVSSNGTLSVGDVAAVQFTTSGPVLTVQTTAGPVLSDIRLSQVSLVRP